MFTLPIPVSDAVAHTFRFRPTTPVQQVNLAGTFNGWSREATPMSLGSDGKTYSVTLKLTPGKYQYKFVLDGNTWVTDPNAKAENDGGGNMNSLLLLVPKDYQRPASPSDGITAKSALQHSTEIPYFNYDRGKLTVSLRVRPGDLKSISARIGSRLYAMKELRRDDFYAVYSVNLPWDRKRSLRYSFVVQDGGKTLGYGPKGLGAESQVGSYVVPKSYQPFEVPEWVQHTVFYQIFPDRFENGDPKNDPTDVTPWDGKPEYFNRFGGDIAGIEKHLDYLANLGISGVYFNPIFKSPSNHRYDTTDYFQIDPEFGTNDQFNTLTQLLTSRGIRPVLDGVFNHTAVDFAAFADVRKNGADSRFTKWYTFNSFPVRVEEKPNYVAWYGFPSMPKVNLDNPETRDYFLTIPKVWDRQAQIFGWRLDVANEVSMDYWRAFRKTVKGIDKNNWILGEEWGDATPWLKGDQWDSAMNYRFRGAVLGLVTKDGSGKPSQFLDTLFSIYHSYAPQVSRNMLNLIGSHDTPRILTLCGEDRELAKMAATVLFTWPGAPSIYYGDELGMSGGADPDNRRGMRWEMENPENDMLAHYRKLISIRNKYPVLRTGDPVRILADDRRGLAVYGRGYGENRAYVVLNRSEKAQDVRLDVWVGEEPVLFDVLNDKAIVVTNRKHAKVSIAPKSAVILVPAPKSKEEIERERRREAEKRKKAAKKR